MKRDSNKEFLSIIENIEIAQGSLPNHVIKYTTPNVVDNPNAIVKNVEDFVSSIPYDSEHLLCDLETSPDVKTEKPSRSDKVMRIAARIFM